MIALRSMGASLSITRAIGKNSQNLTNSLERVSSGKRINRAADDAASLGVATNLETKAKGLRQAVRNANDGVSIIQTAEGGLESAQDMLHRMRELAVQSTSETLASSERSLVQDEFQQLKNQLKSVTTTTSFNGRNLLDGSKPALAIRVGANAASTDTIKVAMANLKGATLLLTPASTATVTDASTAIDLVDASLSIVNRDRSRLGAFHNRLLSAISVTASSADALNASEAQIMDADFAVETANMTKSGILRSAGIASLSQARSIDRSVVRLL